MEELKDLLMRRSGYSEDYAVSILKDVECMDTLLQGIWKNWCQSEEIDDHLRVEGYTVAGLMEQFGLDFTGAILTMDWLIKDPKTAMEALAYGIR